MIGGFAGRSPRHPPHQIMPSAAGADCGGLGPNVRAHLTRDKGLQKVANEEEEQQCHAVHILSQTKYQMKEGNIYSSDNGAQLEFC